MKCILNLNHVIRVLGSKLATSHWEAQPKLRDIDSFVLMEVNRCQHLLGKLIYLKIFNSNFSYVFNILSSLIPEHCKVH